MKRRKRIGLTGLGAVAVLVLAACGGGSSGSGGNPPPGGTTAFNQAVTSVVNPSSHKGGTIIYDHSSTFESVDPGNTYYAANWNFVRLYSMALMTYKSCTGACGLQVVPALAAAPGVVSNHGLTWTYHIQSGIKFSDGSTVTSQDVKYAVERTFARNVLPAGPPYFQSLLGGNAAKYPGPYKDKTPGKMGLTAIDTPNPTTIVFHLKAPFADFNYIAAIPQTAPVPPSKDTGASYQTQVVSTGPYKFQSFQLNKQLTLVPNPFWKASTDPNASQLASKIIVNYNVNANDIDNRLLSGGIQVDIDGTGVQSAARAKIVQSPTLKASSDDPITGFLDFEYIDQQVAPLNNVHCRMAVEFAANKTTLQDAYGGVLQGAIASTAMPPNVTGFHQFDLYHALTKPGGDVAAAKAQLKLCGHPGGFSTGMAYRSDRPRDTAAAQALQQSLAAAGIKLTLHGFPAGTYYTNFAGVPTYMKSHGIGIAAGGWGADWLDGYGWFQNLVAGSAILASGNTNIGALNDPLVNKWLVQMEGTSSTPALVASLSNMVNLQVMKDAVMLPAVYAKALLYRSPQLTNVEVQPYYGMYNYATLGLK